MKPLDKSLSDFMEMPLVREGTVATLTYDEVGGQPLTITIEGCRDEESDYDLREGAFLHYLRLFEELTN